MNGLDTLERTDVKTSTNSGEPTEAHIAEASFVTEGYVMGTPIEAICGKVFVPSRNPDNFPLCGSCKEIADALFINYS